jgi:uncharacterized protein YcfL
MKKTILYTIGIFLISFSLINCGSSKKGCGLTSDAQKIEQNTTANTTVIVAVK